MTSLPRCTRSSRALLATAGALIALAGCDPYVQGNGVYAEEERNHLLPFAGVDVEDGVSVFVTSGEAAQGVRVIGDANVVPHIATLIEERTLDGEQVRVLHIKVSEDFGSTIPPRVIVTLPPLPAFSYVKAREASRIEVKNAAPSTLHVDAAGTSLVTLIGPGVDRLAVTLDDATLDADSYLVALGTDVQLAGGSIARLYSDGEVTGTASGSSRIDNDFGVGACGAVEFSGAATACCVDVRTAAGCPAP